MSLIDLPSRCALVLIDLQIGITALPTIHPADEVVARAARLAAAFRERDLPVVLVRTAFTPDGGDVLRARVDAPPPAITPGPDFPVLRPELAQTERDLVVTKRQWDAFFGTELDLQLRRRRIESIVLAGISTSIGVESTARTGWSLGYELVFASDAVTDLVDTAHDNALGTILPRLGRLATTEAILTSLRA
jgi:nicotinamidase-related amidase